MALTILCALASVATIGTAVAVATKAALKWRERRKYGSGPPVLNLSGRRLTWAERTGMAGQQPRRGLARIRGKPPGR